MRSIILSTKCLFGQSTLAFFFLKNILMILADIYKLFSIRREYIELTKTLSTNPLKNDKTIELLRVWMFNFNHKYLIISKNWLLYNKIYVDKKLYLLLLLFKFNCLMS